MARVKKYRKGETPLTVDEAYEEIIEGRFIFFHGHVMSPGWTQNWSIATLRILCCGNYLYPAIVTLEWKAARGRRLRIAIDAEIAKMSANYSTKESAQ